MGQIWLRQPFSLVSSHCYAVITFHIRRLQVHIQGQDVVGALRKALKHPMKCNALLTLIRLSKDSDSFPFSADADAECQLNRK